MKPILVFVLFAILPFSVLSATSPPLGSWNIDMDHVTVSGFSGGAGFSTQFHVAYSSLVYGMATWAGIPYSCYAVWDWMCVDFPLKVVDVQVLINNTYDLESEGRIDPVENMLNSKLFIYHGTDDMNVQPGNAENLRDYYNEFLANPDQDMLVKNDLPSTHAVVSDHTGTDCGNTNFLFYVENCGYESPYEMLKHMMGESMDVNVPVSPGTYAGDLLTFDQNEFYDNDDAKYYGMADTGYVYVPQACQESQTLCLVHFHFHGCQLYAERIGTSFIIKSGFLELADANNVVIVFPQMISNDINPNGCFDWVGYTNPDNGDKFLYATKEAPQMMATYRMIMKSSGKDSSSSTTESSDQGTTESIGVKCSGGAILTFVLSVFAFLPRAWQY